jgi:hypothetical protein
MRRAMFILAATAGLSLVPAAAAFADAGGVSGGPGYSPPPAVVTNSCDGNIHGAFGAFGGKYNNLGINYQLTKGELPGSQNPHNSSGEPTTGQNNSGASVYCQSLP